MVVLKDYFNIYIDLLMLAIGMYTAFVQGGNLIDDKMEREGRFSTIVGYVYLVLGGIGVLVCII